jgi:UDP-N-acetylglucosamine--N-acetylmuramyl-(pentapeptide) pyrophosphoryl-undecaprenol N-acetylglucosamine transferase
MYILAGGGSGGHLYPGLAVAEALREMEPGAGILFLATEREIDERILGESGYSFIPQPIVPLPRKIRQVWNFYFCWRDSIKLCEGILQQEQPRAVLGLGGYASGPALKVAAKMNIPTAMLNPDAVPGIANRYARRHARKIFLQWESSRQHFDKDQAKCVVTGCPIRKSIITKSDKREAKSALGLEPDKKLLVVMGGSQGGRNVNRAVMVCLKGMGSREDWQILHLTGKEDKKQVSKDYEQAGIAVTVWAYTEQMDKVLAGAELVIGRAGASSLAELTAAGVPSILLPYPYHKDQHQTRNAEVLAAAGAAKIVTDTRDEEKTAKALAAVLGDSMIEEPLQQMADAALQLGKPEAARRVAEELMGMTNDETRMTNQ